VDLLNCPLLQLVRRDRREGPRGDRRKEVGKGAGRGCMVVGGDQMEINSDELQVCLELSRTVRRELYNDIEDQTKGGFQPATSGIVG